MKRSAMPARKTALQSKILPRLVPKLKLCEPMRKSRPKSTPERRAARGMPCQVRVPGYCNGDPATTCLAHYRLAGYSGVGIKPSDGMAAISCSQCHDAIDGRLKTEFSHTELRLMHAEGVMRTRELLKEAA